jgi:hypothetical protein
VGKIGPRAADPTDPSSHSCSLGVRRLPVPAGGDRAGGALVPAVRPVLPGCGGTASRAWHRGRSRDGAPVGAAVQSPAGRCRPVRPASGGRSPACGRDLHQGRGPVGLPVPGGRPVRGRSSTCTPPRGGTATRRAGSSTGPEPPPVWRRWRSSPTAHRPTRGSSRRCGRRRDTASGGTRTTGSRPTTRS